MTLGSRSTDVISQLLEAGVDVNRRNVLGMNALLLVAGYGDERLVKLVLDAGADPASANDFGHTALHLAIVGKRAQLKVFSYNALSLRLLYAAVLIGRSTCLARPSVCPSVRLVRASNSTTKKAQKNNCCERLPAQE